MGRNACSFLLHKSHFIIYKTLPLCHKSRKEAKEDFCTTHHKLPGLKSMLIPWIIHKFEFSKIWIKKNPCKVTHFTNDFSPPYFWPLYDHHRLQFIIYSNTLLMFGWQVTRKEHQCCISNIYRKSILLYFTLCQQFYKLAWPLPCTNNIFQPLRAKELKAQHSLKRDLGNICILKIRTELLTFGANVVVWIGGLRKSRNWFCPFCIDFQ